VVAGARWLAGTAAATLLLHKPPGCRLTAQHCLALSLPAVSRTALSLPAVSRTALSLPAVSRTALSLPAVSRTFPHACAHTNTDGVSLVTCTTLPRQHGYDTGSVKVRTTEYVLYVLQLLLRLRADFTRLICGDALTQPTPSLQPLPAVCFLASLPSPGL